MITFIKQPRKKDNLDSFDSYTFYKNGVENNMITINILLHIINHLLKYARLKFWFAQNIKNGPKDSKSLSKRKTP